MSALITPAELAVAIASETPPRVLDVRWRLDGAEGREDFLREHVPGAVWVDLETELTSHGRPADGRHPMPTLDTLQRAAVRWGLRPDQPIVVLDGGQQLAASRAWWLLDGAGLEVRVLDGGMAAWRAAGLPTESGEVTPEPGTVVIDALPQTIGIEEVAAGVGRLADVRAAARYRGESEPLDPIAGHIPGAVNVPATGFFTEQGAFRDPAAIAAEFQVVPGDPGTAIVAYCGSGVTAAQAALAGRVAGVDVIVFPGSWSAWSNTEGTPIATGPSPAGQIRER